jgi:DNA-binding transcriptional regulator GbsR (MarR family)
MITKSMEKLRVPPELSDVAEQVGSFMEYWGFKNIHGRIWTHIFLSNEPLDAGALIRRLDVSKALMSMSLAELLDHDVIQVAGKSTGSTTTYSANPDITHTILAVLRKREQRMLCRVSSAAKTLSADSQGEVKLNPERIEALQSMIQTAEQTLECLLSLKSFDFSQWSDFTQCDSDG